MPVIPWILINHLLGMAAPAVRGRYPRQKILPPAGRWHRSRQEMAPLATGWRFPRLGKCPRRVAGGVSGCFFVLREVAGSFPWRG